MVWKGILGLPEPPSLMGVAGMIWSCGPSSMLPLPWGALMVGTVAQISHPAWGVMGDIESCGWCLVTEIGVKRMVQGRSMIIFIDSAGIMGQWTEIHCWEGSWRMCNWEQSCYCLYIPTTDSNGDRTENWIPMDYSFFFNIILKLNQYDQYKTLKLKYILIL